MIKFESPALTITLDNGAITELCAKGGKNLIDKVCPFAELEYRTIRPAFTNEWIRPFPMKQPTFATYSKMEEREDGFKLYYTYNDAEIVLDFDVQIVPEAILFTLKSVETDGEKPQVIRFAHVFLDTDGETVATGMSLDLHTMGISYPGLEENQAALVYDHFGYEGRSWAITAAKREDLRENMKKVTKQYVKDILWSDCGGAFSLDRPEINESYMMTFGAFLPGSLVLENVEEWIEMLQDIGITQVDFHGAEDKNFSFGDFEPNREIFPEGRKTFKKLVDRLHEEGIESILHTYSALIGKRSSFVTPVPDKNLGYNRIFTLADDISETATDVPILEDTADISLVLTSYYNSSTYIIWDDEIIEFTELGDHVLKGCIRGALGTKPSAHSKGTQGRNTKCAYYLFTPDVGGPLFDKVAKATAEFVNECGFDAYYFDALEGVWALEGMTLLRTWTAKFINKVAEYTGRSMPMEMSEMNHVLWYTRSRMNAFDYPRRAHKKFIERHAEINRFCQEKNFMTQNLGWWKMGENKPANTSHIERITTDIYDFFGRVAAANGFSMSFQSLSLYDWQKSEELKRSGDRIRRWEKVRLGQELTSEERALIVDCEAYMRPEGIYRASYTENIAQFVDGKASVCIDNPYGKQEPMLIRLETLYTKADAPSKQEKGGVDVDALVLASGVNIKETTTAKTDEFYMLDGTGANDLKTITSRTVTASIADESSPYGNAICFKAKAAKDIGVARFERIFETPVDLTGQYGCGVWVYGDGKGEILNFQLRSPRMYQCGLDNKIIEIDFVGWKYFELYESSDSKVMEYLWPYYYRHMNKDDEFTPLKYDGNIYEWNENMFLTDDPIERNPKHITSEKPDFTHIGYACVWMNNMPEGEECNVKIAGWHSFFTGTNEISDITVKAEEGNIEVKGTLPSDCIVEYSDGRKTAGLGEKWTDKNTPPSWYSSGAKGEVMNNCTASGMITLKPGGNILDISAKAPDGARLRVVCGVKEDKPVISREVK
ncbi:MAG: hypothetical protein IKL42_06170 [Clostridia bacterium]|nr:hypothetical protein [Clostridia bacterium]